MSPQFLRLTGANFCFFLTFATFFLLPLHVRALGGTEQTVGFVMGSSGVAGLVSIAFIGPLLDRFGRRIFLLGGLLVMGLASAAFLLVDHIGPLLVLLRVVQGLAFSAGFNASSTLAAEFAPPGRRAAALGVFGVSTLATHALAPAIGEAVLALGGFQPLFGLAAGYAVVGLVIAWPLPGPPPAHGGDAVASLGDTPGFLSTIGTVGLCGMAFGSVLTYVPTFVQATNLGPVSVFFLSYTAAAVSTRLGAGGLSDSLGRRRIIEPSLALLSVSIVALAAVQSVWMLIASGLLFGVAQGFSYPTLNAFAVDLCEPEQLGRAQTFYNGAFNLGTALGSLALGPVAHAYGHRVAFLCAAAAAAGGLAVFRGNRIATAV